MQLAENALTLDSEVLRFTNLRARSSLDFVNSTREDRNPYVRRVVRMEAEEEEEGRTSGGAAGAGIGESQQDSSAEKAS